MRTLIIAVGVLVAVLSPFAASTFASKDVPPAPAVAGATAGGQYLYWDFLTDPEDVKSYLLWINQMQASEPRPGEYSYVTAGRGSGDTLHPGRDGFYLFYTIPAQQPWAGSTHK